MNKNGYSRATQAYITFRTIDSNKGQTYMHNWPDKGTEKNPWTSGRQRYRASEAASRSQITAQIDEALANLITSMTKHLGFYRDRAEKRELDFIKDFGDIVPKFKGEANRMRIKKEISSMIDGNSI